MILELHLEWVIFNNLVYLVILFLEAQGILMLQTGTNGAAIIINSSNDTIINNASTHLSTLFISGTSIFQNAVSCNSTLNITNATTCNSTLNITIILTLGNNSGLYLNKASNS